MNILFLVFFKYSTSLLQILFVSISTYRILRCNFDLADKTSFILRQLLMGNELFVPDFQVS